MEKMNKINENGSSEIDIPNNIITSKHIVFSWLLLITLTCVSVVLTQLSLDKTLFISSAFLIVFFKGYQITDIFMELRLAPKKWRLLLMSYIIIVPLILGCIYSF